MLDDYPMAGPADIALDDFTRILAQNGSPALVEDEAMYAACLAEGVSPVTFLAFFNHESRYGKLGICHDYDTKNPGNVRSPEDPSLGEIIQTRGGPFAKYPSWQNGTLDWGKRIVGPKYAGAGLTTVRGVLPKYAPTGDNNDPEAYIRSVLTYIEAHGIPEVVAQQVASLTVGGASMADIIVDTPRPGPAAGAFTAVPRGVILHGSRGGAADLDREYRGTAAWAASNPDGLCWNATIGEGIYCVHLSALEWGWNARAASQSYLAVEFAQPRLSSPITDAMVAAFVAWYTAEVAPVWPGLMPATVDLPMHSELASGVADGKSDAFLAGSAEATNLRARIRTALGVALAGAGPPYATADEAFNAYLEREGETAVWAGSISGKGHWTATGRDPLELCRTDANAILGYDGAQAVDVAGSVLDDWEHMAQAAGQLHIY